MTTKEKAFARRKQFTTVTVPMPEWGDGETIIIRELSAAERDKYEAEQADLNKTGRGLVNFRARLVALCAVNADGTPFFEAGDAEAIGELPASDVRKLFDAAAKINALTKEEKSEIEKNS